MLRTWFHNLLLALVAALILAVFMPAAPVSAAGTTSVKIVRLASDNLTILNQITLTYQQMRDSVTMIPLGDGITHYYHQGKVSKNDTDPDIQEKLRWNEEENDNVLDKDMGAVKGTNLRDLCNLVGGMAPGETLTANATDHWRYTFAYKNVYNYSSREGPIGLTWYKNGMYPDSGYTEGMRLVWFADTSINPWGIHAFGNWDWHETAARQYYYYYLEGGQKYPTTTGLSGQVIEQITIHSHQPSWDLNSDHTCNQDDVIALGQHWDQTQETDPQGWIPDVNQDGVINIGDVVAVGYHWNQTW
jgi:hypothetical protein